MKKAWLVLDMANGYMDGWYLIHEHAEKVRERWEKSTGRDDFVCLQGIVDTFKPIVEELYLPMQLTHLGN